jgi:hypothetical protein
MNGKNAIQTFLGSKLAGACLTDFAFYNLSFISFNFCAVSACVSNAHHHHHHHSN